MWALGGSGIPVLYEYYISTSSPRLFTFLYQCYHLLRTILYILFSVPLPFAGTFFILFYFYLNYLTFLSSLLFGSLSLFYFIFYFCLFLSSLFLVLYTTTPEYTTKTQEHRKRTKTKLIKASFGPVEMEAAEPVSYDFPGHAVGGMAPRRILNPHLGPNFFYPNPTASFPMPYQSSPSAPYNFGHHHHHHHHPHQQQQQHHHHHHALPSLTNPDQHHPQQHHHLPAPPPQPAPAQPHPSAYQPQPQPQPHFFMTGHQQPLHSQPVRLSSEPPPFQGIPDIRPAKNAVNRVGKDPLAKPVPGTGASSSASTPQAATNGATTSQDKNSTEIDFSTEVDVLMKTIQAKNDSEQPTGMQAQQSLPPLQQLTHGNQLAHASASMYPPPAPPGYPMAAPPVASPHGLMEEPASRSGKKRKYTCTLPHCGKGFSQKTHLDIHIRAHTGDKPFVSNPTILGHVKRVRFTDCV